MRVYHDNFKICEKLTKRLNALNNLAMIVDRRKWRNSVEGEVKTAALEIGNKAMAIASSSKKADTSKLALVPRFGVIPSVDSV